METAKFLPGGDDVSGHLAEDAGLDDHQVEGRPSLPKDDGRAHLAGDAGMTEQEFDEVTGQSDEPSGLTGMGHALAPPG